MSECWMFYDIPTSRAIVSKNKIGRIHLRRVHVQTCSVWVQSWDIVCMR